jgi:hypothetical protein
VSTKYPLSEADAFVEAIGIAALIAARKMREGGLDSVTRNAVVQARKNPKLLAHDLIAALVVAGELAHDIGEDVVRELSE